MKATDGLPAKEKAKRGQPKVYTWRDVRSQLEELVILLMTVGHPNCLDYGYGFFKAVCRFIQKQQRAVIKQYVLGTKTAIALALAKPAETKRFIREMDRE